MPFITLFTSIMQCKMLNKKVAFDFMLICKPAYTCLLHDSVCFHILCWYVKCVEVLVCGPSVNSVPQVFSSRLQRPGKAQLQPSGVFTTISLYRAARGPCPPTGSPPLCLLSGSLSQNTPERRSGESVPLQRTTPLLHTHKCKRKEETEDHLFPAVGSERLYAARVVVVGGGGHALDLTCDDDDDLIINHLVEKWKKFSGKQPGRRHDKLS